ASPAVASAWGGAFSSPRQANPELCAPCGAVAGGDRSRVGINDPLRDRQTQARAGGPPGARLVSGIEAIEDVGQVFLAQAGPVVSHRKVNFVSRRRAGDLDRRVGRREL